MKKVEPSVHIIGETRLSPGLPALLEEIGAPNWQTDAPSDSEELVEFYGRLCYRSFAPGLNPNVSKIRVGNGPYLSHIVESGHGSVTEHVSINFVLHNVSRCLTHELVRHRVGVAISQESLRYVRLDSLRMWLPSCIQDDPWAVAKYEEIFTLLERVQLDLAEHFDVENIKDFSRKKELTSAFRRLAPIGLATTIGWSANIRTLRHVIPLRSHESAEEEIRVVFDKIGQMCKSRYPNLFADFERVEVRGIGEWHTPRPKI